MLDSVLQAARGLRHRPTYAIVSVSLLALGIAAVSAIFAVVDVALLRPLPYANADRLQALRSLEPSSTGDSTIAYGLAAAQYVRWREAEAFDAVEGLTGRTIALGGNGEPEALRGMQVTAGMFALLGTPPARGRPFARDEETSTSTVAIISHSFWQRRLRGEAAAIGQTLTLDGRPRTIVGIMPDEFNLLFGETDVWVPLALDPSQMAGKVRVIYTIGRLKTSVSAIQATAELNRTSDAIGAEIPQFRRTRARVLPLKDELFGSDRASLLVIVSAVSLLMLIAVVNVLNLTLSDGLARRQTTMIRLALGAAPSDVFAVRVGEATIIAAVAGAVGLGLGRLALAGLRMVGPDYFAGFGPLTLDARVVLVALSVAVVGAAIAALPAAFTEARLGIETLASAAAHSVGSRRDQRIREALLAGQVALALTLLFAATLLVKNLRALGTVPQGFKPAGLLSASFRVPPRYATQTERAVYLQRLVDAVGQVPGVSGASAIQAHFALGSSSQSFFAIEGKPLPEGTGQVANIRHVMPGILTVLGMRLIEGRFIESTDRENTRVVAVVNASFARALLDGRAIGARIRRTTVAEFPWMEVVGVVEDVKDAGLGVDLGPTLYVSYVQENQPIIGMNIVTRLRDPKVSVERSVQQAIWSVDRTQALSRIATIESLQHESTSQPRFQMLVVVLFAGSALVLVVGGIYALTLFSVLKRTREIGVRAALGAGPGALVGHAVWQGLRSLAIGVVVGLAAAVPAVQLMQRSLNQQFSASDAPMLVVVLLILVGASSVAAMIPARRATRVSPLIAMRSVSG